MNKISALTHAAAWLLEPRLVCASVAQVLLQPFMWVPLIILALRMATSPKPITKIHFAFF